MKIKIYQIDKDKNNVKFARHELLRKYQGASEIDASIYKEVFSGDVECETLEDVYTAFNTEPQPLHRGHSLSVSDIVVNEDGAYFCDSIGFRKVDFDESKAQKAGNLLKSYTSNRINLRRLRRSSICWRENSERCKV